MPGLEPRTVLSRAQESGLAVLASDVQGDATLERAGSIQKLQIQSVMCVPLGRPVEGMIYVDHRAKIRSFAKDDLEFLTAIALYASLVLRHARAVRAALKKVGGGERAVETGLLAVDADRALLEELAGLALR